MKTMKRVLALAMVLGIVFALSACGGGKDMSNSPYCGTWTATTAEYAGLELDVADLYEGGLTIELGADGKASAVVDGETETGSWDETDTGVILKGGSGLELTADDNGGLYIEQDGVTIYFAKQ